MKTYKDLDKEMKEKLVLYWMFKKDLLSRYGGMIILGFITFVLGLSLSVLSTIMHSMTEEVGLFVIFQNTFWLGMVVWILGAIFMFLEIYLLNKNKKKLQVAFEMETDGCFTDLFDVSDKDIEHVKRIWFLGNKDEKK